MTKVDCKCFYREDDHCFLSRPGPMATCPDHAERVDAETGLSMPGLKPGPEIEWINGDPQLGAVRR